MMQKGEVNPDDEKKKAEDAEAKKDVFLLMLAVIGTLLVISAFMVPILPPSQVSH
jgi:farnesyl-diphosphate farnesyltransferase